MSQNGEYDILVSADVAASIPLGLRQGHRCCGGCCDMRRAVVIVNIVHCLIALYAILSMAVTARMVDDGEIKLDRVDDDELLEEGGDFFRKMEQRWEWVLAVYVVFAAVGIYGAVTFKNVAVGVSLGLYVVEFFVGAFGLKLLSVFIAVFFAYPHVFFIMQVRQGIMSKENYELEKHSCCCV